jgi:hypothetical protein
VTKGVGLCVALFATAALAQMVPEREVEIIQSL